MIKNKAHSKKFFLSIALTAGLAVLVVDAYMQHTNAPCKNLLAHSEAGQVFSTQPSIQDTAKVSCVKNNQQVTWVTWLFRKPDSMQFHYIDLINLLNRNKA